MRMTETEARLWAETVAKLVADTESRLIWIIKDTADRGLGANQYAVSRLQDLAVVRARLEAELGRSWDHVIDYVQDVLDQAREAGQGQASRDLRGLGLPETLPAQMALGVEQIARDTLLHLSGMPALILRDSLDEYQRIMTGPVTDLTMGAVERRRATQDALTGFAKRGIDSFTDKAGRRWRIDSYAEMATRTGAMNAMRYGWEQTMQAAGVDLVIVSSGHGYTCPKCAPWEGKILSLTGATPTGWNQMEHATLDGVMVRFEVAGTVAEAKAAGLMHPNCFPGDVLVEAPTGVDASDTRWYEGDVIVIETASGNELTVTPNHPVLTPEGWVPAGALREGMDVICYDRWDDVVLHDGPDQVHVPTPISNVHRALRESGTVATVRMPASAHQFHGDGVGHGEVEVVLSDRLLCDHGLAELAQNAGNGILLSGGVSLGALFAARPPFQVPARALHPSNGVVSGRGSLGSFLRGLTSSCTAASLGSWNDRVPEFSVLGRESGLGEPNEGTGLLLGELAGKVSASNVVKVGRRKFAGHVYNLETGNHWYVASSIVVHNCEHSWSRWQPGVTVMPEPQPDPVTYAASQQQRALERDIRAAKRELAAALGPEAEHEARVKIRAAQAQVRDLLAEHDKLTRKPAREQVKTAH